MRSARENASWRSWVTGADGDPEWPQDPRDLVAELAAQRRVDVRPRLVEQHDAGRGRERARERDALLLAARELVRVALAEAAQVDEREQRGKRGAHGRPRGRPKPTFSATVRCGKSA